MVLLMALIMVISLCIIAFGTTGSKSRAVSAFVASLTCMFVIGAITSITVQDTTIKEIAMEENLEEKDLETFCGFEIPRETSAEARNVLVFLEMYGLVRYRYDDGPSLWVMEELSFIAGSIGLDMFVAPYELVLFSNDVFVIDGTGGD